jgi:hypothetical protein
MSLAVTATGAANAGVTVTLPASANNFHYIDMIEIVKYATATIVGGTVPAIVTTTNMPGSIAFTFDSAQAIGTCVVRTHILTSPLSSSVLATDTTIVCPATTNIIWRANIYYYVAP